jgi:acyl dehydratase
VAERTGRITDEALERLSRRIGVPMRIRQRPHVEVATSDAMRHFAHGYGDDNPLYCDPSYGEATAWGGQIAPPLFPLCTGTPTPVQWTPEQADAMAGGDPLAGVGQYLRGERWQLFAPVCPGQRLERTEMLWHLEPTESEFGGGRAVVVTNRVVYRCGGEPVAVRDLEFLYAERTASATAAKYADVPEPNYTDDDLAAIDALYEAEVRRGREDRLASSVRVGDGLGRLAKGPLTVTELIAYHMGLGWGVYGGGASRLAYLNRRRVPKLYVRDRMGVPDTVQRCHWDSEQARALGHPRGFDYGAMRTNWMVHLVTNWMGDHGFLVVLESRILRFNYLGDAHVIEGRVAAVRSEQGEVDVEVRGTNQRGELTCRMAATVRLPTAPGALPPLPAPPRELA